jgi:dTMP kinase
VSASATSPGRFITLEGGEGSGKTTQAARLADALRHTGLGVHVTREPGGWPTAELIRKLLVEGEPGRWQPMTEVLLHFAARAEHVHHVIEPALAGGTWVVCDRFADSTMAYQGYGQGVPRTAIEAVQQASIGNFLPDLTLILDCDVGLGLTRAVGRAGAEDRYERMDRAFHERLRQGFLDIARRNRARCAVVDCTGELDVVTARLMASVESRLGLKLSA